MASQRDLSQGMREGNLTCLVDPPQSKASGEKITISAEAKCLAGECRPDEEVTENNLTSDAKMTLRHCSQRYSQARNSGF
jgi:hypothetical protein